MDQVINQQTETELLAPSSCQKYKNIRGCDFCIRTELVSAVYFCLMFGAKFKALLIVAELGSIPSEERHFLLERLH